MNKYIFLILGVFVSFASFAQQERVPVGRQEDLTMTIYNNNLALVKDIRKVNFSEGVNQISFEDISNLVIPSSVLFSSENVSVQEQNFNFDLLTDNNLLKKSIGKEVVFEQTDENGNRISSQKAKILAYTGGQPVLQVGNEIKANYKGWISFYQVPENLSAKPSLVFDVNSKITGEQNAQVSYLTKGLGWNADYVAELGNDMTLSLNGLITLTNMTQVSYNNVRLQLVAGEVHEAGDEPNYRRGVRRFQQSFSEDSLPAESVSGYYLYTLPHTTSILPNQTKQVSLMTTDGVKAQRSYEYSSPLSFYSDNDFKDFKPKSFLSFENTENNNLGLPLPKGIIRVYAKEKEGRLIFVGEDRISHTAKNQQVKLELGEDFDITATGKRVDFQKLDSKRAQASFEVKISSAKSEPVIVRYKQSFPDSWRILAESQPSQKETSNTIYWDVELAPETEALLTFKVLVTK